MVFVNRVLGTSKMSSGIFSEAFIRCSVSKHRASLPNIPTIHAKIR